MRARGAWAALGLAALGAFAAGRARAGDAYLRRSATAREVQEAWIREARRRGLAAALVSGEQRQGPDAVPLDHVRRVGEVLAVRAGEAAGPDPEPPSLRRTLYHRPFPRRGPDQIPVPGQWFLERWVDGGGAALSTFSSRDLFHYTADEPVPGGDVLLALGWVAAEEGRALYVEQGVVHVARLRGARRRRGLALEGLPPTPWRLPPDRRPALEVLSLDARSGGFDLVVHEPLARRTVWAGGAAPPGAFTAAVAHALPATSMALGKVVGLAVGVPGRLLDPLGRPGSPWTRRGLAPARDLLPARWRPGVAGALWVALDGARRDHVRAVAAWATRARPPPGRGSR